MTNYMYTGVCVLELEIRHCDITEKWPIETVRKTTTKSFVFIPFRVPIEKRFKGIAGLWRFSGLLGQKNPCRIAG